MSRAFVVGVRAPRILPVATRSGFHYPGDADIDRTGAEDTPDTVPRRTGNDKPSPTHAA
jgi:hypothetical protein